MLRVNIKIFLWVVLFSFANCLTKNRDFDFEEYSKHKLLDINRKLTDVIIADIFTPPVASRIYAYANLAAYETMQFSDKKYDTFGGILNGYGQTPEPNTADLYFSLSGLIAFTTVAEQLVFNGDKIKKIEAEYLLEIENLGIDADKYERSVEYGRLVGAHILAWAKQDGYRKRTGLAGYMVNTDPGRWQPTPPNYMEAIEPNWNTLRPFVISNASQFDPVKPIEFDTVPESKFYIEAKKVYDTVNNMDKEKLDIANFWDCNPNISYTQGHVILFKQKISPGGHWIHITLQVLKNEKASMMRSTEVLTKVALTLNDAFISCWDAKFKNSVIRPETYINRYIDPKWQPILQTPPFPEYPSGHSVVSSGAATMLTYLYGDSYSFSDSTEVPFGMPVRNFKSFNNAADEAAISRLYGGIHFLNAITAGTDEGKRLANFMITRFEELNN